MALVNRATLPQEFFDVTSARLLTAPEPMYLHAKLFKMALNAAFDMSGELGFAADRSFGGAGAPYANAEDGRLVLSDGLYDGAIEVVPELGKAPGHTVRLNRPSFTDTTYTEASREVPSGSSISTTPIAVGSGQVPITLKRYAGPYSSSASAVAPIGVDRFDASVMLHRPAQIAAMNLKRDFDRTLDAFMVALFDNAGTTMRPVGMTDDDTSVVAGDFPFDYDLMERTEQSLDEANVPVFGNGKRIMVLHPNQCRQLSEDNRFARYARYDAAFNPLFNGNYWKSCGNWDVFKSTTLSSAANTNSITIYDGQAFGPGAVGAGVGELPRAAYSTSDNYGEQALVIWLAYLGMATLDNRFIRKIATS